jgi:hypothetical protein
MIVPMPALTDTIVLAHMQDILPNYGAVKTPGLKSAADSVSR